MKKLIFLMALVCSTAYAVDKNYYYFTIQTQLKAPDNGVPDWLPVHLESFKNYPHGMAEQGAFGCAVAQFTLQKDGRAKNIEITNTHPRRYHQILRKETAKAVRSLYLPMTEQGQETTLQLRVDYCSDGESPSEAQELCHAQMTATCS